MYLDDHGVLRKNLGPLVYRVDLGFPRAHPFIIFFLILGEFVAMFQLFPPSYPLLICFGLYRSKAWHDFALLGSRKK